MMGVSRSSADLSPSRQSSRRLVTLPGSSRSPLTGAESDMMRPSSLRDFLILSGAWRKHTGMMIEFHFAQRTLRRKEKTSMFRLHFVATCFAIITLGTTAITAGTLVSTRNGDVMEITDLQPFTHVAEIPVGSQTSSIRIEGIKLVKIATKRRTVTNEVSCNQPWAEPGGSMFCQRTADESPVPAYRVTYSYRSQPMASDEYGNSDFTFSVYFRPDEISPRLRELVAGGKAQRAE